MATLKALSLATRTSTDFGLLKHCDTSINPVTSLDFPAGHDKHAAVPDAYVEVGHDVEL
tara:strand:- start:28 stop:204 length:177 start_codon:yes stop_codon:yes gene_type:complete